MIDKISFGQLDAIMDKHKGEGLVGYIVFTADSFIKPYSEKSRTYRIDSNSNRFDSSKISTALWGDCLDGTDEGVRLDWYMFGENAWKVDYCYLERG